MDCPNQEHGALSQVLTKRGVVIDRCQTCGGIWLDRGEVFHFTRHPERVRRELVQASTRTVPSDKISPASGVPMMEITYRDGPQLYLCPESGGLWLDGDVQMTLTEMEPGLHFDLDATDSTAPKHVSTIQDQAAGPASSLGTDAPPLYRLPSLFYCSALALVGMYALLVAILIAAVEFAGIGLDVVLGTGVIVAILQFLLSPFLMDVILRWLYKARRLDLKQLPPHLLNFVERVSADQGIKPPRFFLIDDGAPQAFTFGHTPNNARIALSRGILELLEPDEVEAVVAHEIGHAVHWDMLLMTVTQLVPLLLYYLYRSLISSSRSDGQRKENNISELVAIGAYILYIVSEYMVLWFSRTREYHADRFAGEVTGHPSHLANALVKIAYGLAGRTKRKEEATRKRLDAVGPLGIFNAAVAQRLALVSYDGATSEQASIDRDSLKRAMRWDLWNPWAHWYELHSTHPLVASRLLYLSNQSQHMSHEPFIVFDDAKPESYWDEFLVDVSIHLLPIITLLALPGVFLLFDLWSVREATDRLVGITLSAMGSGMMLRFLFVYRRGPFLDVNVAALLKRVKVSAVRSVPCRIRGTVIGRGVPGLIWSEDFVLKDDSGIIFLDYRQPLAIWELVFGLLCAGGYTGRQVVVEGWYRRAPAPYIEIKSITCDGNMRRSWVPMFYLLTALAFALLGVGLVTGPGNISMWLIDSCGFHFIFPYCAF